MILMISTGKNDHCVPDPNYKSSQINSKGGGCLIATATCGSEISLQVQHLREIRDSKLLNTESGSSFMSTFNNFYYSFSPYVADYERENLWQKGWYTADILIEFEGKSYSEQLSFYVYGEPQPSSGGCPGGTIRNSTGACV